MIRRIPLVAVVVALAACSAAPVSSSVPSSRSASTPTVPASPARPSEPGAVLLPQEAGRREAARLLALAQVPPGAVAQTRSRPPLTRPEAVPAVESLVSTSRTWLVPSSMAQTRAWLRAHPPAGLSPSATSTFGIPSGGDGYGVTYSDAHPPAQVDTGWLELAVAASGKGSLLRADALVVWLDPVPYPDNAPGPRLRVTVAGGCPADDHGAIGVSNAGADLDTVLLPDGAPSSALICTYAGLNGATGKLDGSARVDPPAAAVLAADVRRVRLAHPDGGTRSCPSSDGTVSLVAFALPERDDVDLWWPRGGCSMVGNGHIKAAAPATTVAFPAGSTG